MIQDLQNESLKQIRDQKRIRMELWPSYELYLAEGADKKEDVIRKWRVDRFSYFFRVSDDRVTKKIV